MVKYYNPFFHFISTLISPIICGFFLFFATVNPAFAFPPDSTQLKKDLKNIILNHYDLGDKRQLNPTQLPGILQSGSEQAAWESLYASMLHPAYDASRSYHVKKCHSLIEKIKKENRFVDILSTGTFKIDLPIGISKKVGNSEFTIMIDSVYNNGEGMFMQVYMSLESPFVGTDENGQPRRLAFHASGIEISASGGFNGTGRLDLLEDFPIKIGQDSYLVLQSDSLQKEGTFASFDCGGFKEMGLKAELIFSRKMLIPEDVQGNRIPEGTPNSYVRGRIQVISSGWDDIVARVNLPPFQAGKLEGVSFFVEDAIFDFSDIRNDATFMLPPGYTADWLPSNESTLWRGIFIKNLIVKLPKTFKKKQNPNDRIYFRLYNMIIDQQGFSGEIEAKNLISRKDGTTGKWPFSLEYLHIKIQANQFKKAVFDGAIRLPVTKTDSNSFLIYHAIINPENDEYIFNVKNTDTLDVPLWAANMKLLPNSMLEVKVIQGKFNAKAILNGSLSITKNKLVYIPDISFEELLISSEAPYLNAKRFSTASPDQQKVGNYPVVINKIDLRKETATNSTILFFDIQLNLDGGGISGGTACTIWSNMEEGSGEQSWKFKSFRVDKITVKVEKSGFKLDATAQFYENDPTYGNGFRGKVNAVITPEIEIGGDIMFGNINANRFWYVDALLTKESGIPVMGAFSIYGFIGGISQNMRSDYTGSTQTLAGYEYVPDTKYALILHAGVILGVTGKKQTMNGEAAFELKINASGGVSYIGFVGVGQMMKDIEVSQQALKNLMAKLSAKGDISFFGSSGEEDPAKKEEVKKKAIGFYLKFALDFDNQTMFGNMGVSINAGALAGEGHLALYFSPSDWYVFIGTPQNRLRFKFPVGPLNLEVNAYIMVGTMLPATVPPPERVRAILGLPDPTTDELALKKGAGFAFGAGLELSKSIDFLIFYAKFAIGAGFDVMIRDFGPDARCKGSNSPIGINGWYATGQAYAYVEGSIGIKVKIFKKEKTFNILDIGAAVLLQAQLPSPTWMRGIVGGRYSVLGGLVSGNCKFEVTMGQKCEIIGTSNILASVDIITDVTPAKNDTDVDVFTVPQAVFSMEIEKSFRLVDLNGETKIFRAKMDKFEILDENGNPLRIKSLTKSADGRTVGITSFDILPPKKQLKVIIEVVFQELVGKDWKPVIIDGVAAREKEESIFTTGDAPDFIPKNNIAFTYPVMNQLNYYPGEYDQGYIQLIRGQSYLFGKDETYQGQLLRLSPSDNGARLENWVKYDADIAMVQFAMPTALQKDMVYKWEILNIPANANFAAIDQNVQTVSVTNSDAENENSVSIASRQATGTLQTYVVKNIFGVEHFKTSKYQTMADKFNAMDLSKSYVWLVYAGIHEIGVNYLFDEGFDTFETIGGSYCSEPLIDFEMDLNNDWYRQKMYPLLYQYIPNEKIRLGRETGPFGIPPSRTVYIDQRMDNLRLNPGSPLVFSNAPTYGIFKSMMVIEMARDYTDFGSKVVFWKYSGFSYPWFGAFLNSSFTPLQIPGNYKMTVFYKLPGIEKMTFSREIFMNLVYITNK